MTPLALRLESALLPPPDSLEWREGKVIQIERSFNENLKFRISQTFHLLSNLALLPFAIAYSLTGRTLSIFTKTPKTTEPTESPKELSSALPADFGFADSLFQTSGLGTSFSPTDLKGRSNWEKWLTPKNIEGSENYKDFFVDVLNHPSSYIRILKEMHVTAHRFSLEWSVIEPESGKIDLKAVQLYRRFIQELKREGIEPYVTLHHFVLPDWVGDFDDPENIERFTLHSLKMMELFPEVVHWMTFNEPGVYAFSTRMRGAFPPGEKGNLIKTAQVLRNLLIAHCQIYQKGKERFGDKVQIGITHQWLRFVPLEGNFVERSICYILSKITHYCVLDFFKTGRFHFEIAGKANVHLSIPENEFQKHQGFLDFIGVQFYGYPRIKAGFNGGEAYPGYKTNNFNLGFTGLTFGATCPKGGKTLSFGPSFYPESLEACLTEAATLNKPIAITETGCDARIQKWGENEFKIDDATQREYFEKIAPILHKFKDQMKAFFVWTLYRGQLEWDRGDFPALGVVQFKKDPSRNIAGFELTPAAKLLQNVFREKVQNRKAA